MATFIYVQISLQKVLRPCPVPAVRLIKNDPSNPHIINLSPWPHVDPKISASATSYLSYLSGTVKFSSPCSLALQSTFLVYFDDSNIPQHSEIAPLKCLSSPTKQTGWLYSSEIAPDFWDTLCSSPGRLNLSYASNFDQWDYVDLTRYTILQSVKPIPTVQFESDAVTDSNRASPTVFLAYKFNYQEPGLQTSFNTVAPGSSAYPTSYPTSTPSYNQVNRPPKNHLLNNWAHVIHSIARHDGYQPSPMANAVGRCGHEVKLFSYATAKWADILFCTNILGSLPQSAPTRSNAETWLCCSRHSSAAELLC
jgi:transcriptional enhancer factor